MRKSLKIVCASLLAITIACAALWWTFGVRPRQKYEEALAWMGQIGATLHPGYHMVLPSADFLAVDVNKLAAGDLSKLRGIRYLGQVRLANIPRGDSFVEVLMGLPNQHLSWFVFENLGMTVRGFSAIASNRLSQCKTGSLDLEFRRMDIAAEHLRPLTALACGVHLSFVDAPVTTELLQVIATIPNVHSLRLRRTGPLDAGHIKALAHAAKLHRLVFDGVPVGSGLALLRNQERLQVLELRNATIDPRGLAGLADLPRLRQLDLRGSIIDDAAMDSIARFPVLASLNIARTGITDAGFAKLAAAKSLRIVFVRGAPISEAAKAALVAARPDITIESRWNAD